MSFFIPTDKKNKMAPTTAKEKPYPYTIATMAYRTLVRTGEKTYVVCLTKNDVVLENMSCAEALERFNGV